MKMQVLFRGVDDWEEVYINGELIHESVTDDLAPPKFDRLLDWLLKQPEIDLEYRIFFPDYKYGGEGDYKPPLHIMTGETYWADWEKGQTILPTGEDEDVADIS